MSKQRARPTKRRQTRRGRDAWAELPDRDLLDMRMCDLDLSLEGTAVESLVGQLHDELSRRGIRLRPHVWLSSEWFSPDGVPGFAIPFYLAHERLRRLERKMMSWIEGGTAADCMRILRHEAGHAVCNAFRLHYRKRWRDLFGRFSHPYPKSYVPQRFSRAYVVHLRHWYAQAHPAEDFAETFAVWLTPGTRWHETYHDWPALGKLEYVDEAMQSITGKAPPVKSRRRPEPLSKQTTTLREHYVRKQRLHGEEWPDTYDNDLSEFFSSEHPPPGQETAAAMLRRLRPELRRMVAARTGAHEYTIDEVLQDMIDRSNALRLRVPPQWSQRSRREVQAMMTVQTIRFLHGGRRRFTL